MSYPTKIHIRHSTVLVIVLLLMGSVLYEVTRTESQSSAAARTQDISLPAPQPPSVARLAARTHDYIGGSSVRTSRIRAEFDDTDVVAGTGVATADVRFTKGDAAPGRTTAATVGGSAAPARSHSAGGSGFAPGGFGMSGVGAWGGVSGMVRPVPTSVAETVRPTRVARATSTSTSTRPRPAPRSGSGGGATTGAAATASGTELLAGGFTTGAAAVDGQPGTVASLQTTGSAAAPGPAPSPTPEPMSFLLVGTGLVAVYNARRFFQ